MDKKKVEDFLNGKDSVKGEQIFNKWYDSFPEVQYHAEIDTQLLQKEVDRIKNGKQPVVKVIYFSSAWRKIAAVVLPLIIASAIITYSNRSALLNVFDPVAYSQSAVPAGKRTQVTLADGSIVWLNAGSSLRYPENFKRTTREVYLSGEAFFEVARDEHKPFIVYTKNLAVRVLGTSFNIQAYPERDKEEVTVVTGKVNVTGTSTSNAKESVNLVPGQRATYATTKEVSAISLQHNLRTEGVGVWRESKLVFDGMSVRDIVLTLQQHYAASVTLGDSSLSEQKISAEFVEVLPLEKVLGLLSVTLNTCYSKEGENYVLGAEACRSVKKESN